MSWQLTTKLLAIGALNTLVGYGCYALFIFLGIQYAIALLMATIIGIFFNFKSTGVYIFHSHDNNKIFKFLIVYGFVYLLNVAVLGLLSFMGFNAYFSGAISVLPMALMAFYLNSKYVFPVSGEHTGATK